MSGGEKSTTDSVDRDLLQIVASDIRMLDREWNKQDIDDDNVRRASTSLRMLLVEQRLIQAARSLDFEIRIMAPATDELLIGADLSSMKFFQAGGAKHREMNVMGVQLHDRALSPREIKERYERQKHVATNQPMNVSKFLGQVSFVLEGTRISRDEVIKYVANKIGGAHFDRSRGSSALEKKYALLDKVHSGSYVNVVAGKAPVFYELLSIGQYVGNSRHVQRLASKIDDYLKR